MLTDIADILYQLEDVSRHVEYLDMMVNEGGHLDLMPEFKYKIKCQNKLQKELKSLMEEYLETLAPIELEMTDE